MLSIRGAWSVDSINMSKTNCVNCGAAKDIDEIKCPYCGTTYLDLTSIDFDSNDHVVCQFLLPGKYKMGGMNPNGRIMMSMLALPRIEEISSHTDMLTVCNGLAAYAVTESYSVNVGVSFTPVCKPGSNTLFTLKVQRDLTVT